MSVRPKDPDEAPPTLGDWLALVGFVLVMAGFVAMGVTVLAHLEVSIAAAVLDWWRG